MIRTKPTRTIAPAGFAPVCKLDHPYRCLLPVLALCVAGVAWSQPAHGARAPASHPIGLADPNPPHPPRPLPPVPSIDSLLLRLQTQ